MKAILRFVIYGVLITHLFLFMGGQNIKTVDGIKIIQNKKKPAPPKDIPTKVTLNLETIFGESDDPDKAFSQLSSFVVDNDGTIYALDFITEGYVIEIGAYGGEIGGGWDEVMLAKVQHGCMDPLVRPATHHFGCPSAHHFPF